MVSHLVLRYAKSSGMRLRARRRYRVVYAHSRYGLAERNLDRSLAQQIQRSKKRDPTMNAPGGKRLMPDTPDRESSAPKRRRLVPTSRGTQGVPPEMASQVANFRLVGSPKRKAYKPRKRRQVGEGKYFCVKRKPK